MLKLGLEFVARGCGQSLDAFWGHDNHEDHDGHDDHDGHENYEDHEHYEEDHDGETRIGICC